MEEKKADLEKVLSTTWKLLYKEQVLCFTEEQNSSSCTVGGIVSFDLNWAQHERVLECSGRILES